MIVGFERNLALWNLSLGKELFRVEGDAYFVGSVYFSSDGNTLVGWEREMGAHVFDVLTGRELSSDQDIRGVPPIFSLSSSRTVAISPDKTVVALGTGYGHVELWDALSAKLLRSVDVGDDSITSLAFSPDGRSVVIGTRKSGRGRVAILDPASTQPVQFLDSDFGIVNVVLFSPDGRRAFAGGDEGMKIWELTSGAEVCNIEHLEGFSSGAFSSDGHWLVTGG
jgi:WD40 repeat protein